MDKILSNILWEFVLAHEKSVMVVGRIRIQVNLKLGCHSKTNELIFMKLLMGVSLDPRTHKTYLCYNGKSKSNVQI